MKRRKCLCQRPPASRWRQESRLCKGGYSGRCFLSSRTSSVSFAATSAPVSTDAFRVARGLDELVEVLLLLTETEEQLLRGIDLAILDRRHDVEGVLRGEHQHGGDVVDELLEQPGGVGVNAWPVHAELQRRGALRAFAGKQPRVALESAEDLLQAQGSRFRGRAAPFRPCVSSGRGPACAPAPPS